jgi:nitrate reductase gamma subunit
VTKQILSRLSALFSLGHSAVLPLLGVVFMVWSFIDPTPMHGMATMTAGQALGTAAFALYVFLVVRELRSEMLRAQSRDPS